MFSLGFVMSVKRLFNLQLDLFDLKMYVDLSCRESLHSLARVSRVVSREPLVTWCSSGSLRIPGHSLRHAGVLW